MGEERKYKDKNMEESERAWELITKRNEVTEQKNVWDHIKTLATNPGLDIPGIVHITSISLVNRYRVKYNDKYDRDALAMASLILAGKIHDLPLTIEKVVNIAVKAKTLFRFPWEDKTLHDSTRAKLIDAVIEIEMKLVMISCMALIIPYPWNYLDNLPTISDYKPNQLKSATWQLLYYIAHIPLEFFYDPEVIAKGTCYIIISIFSKDYEQVKSSLTKETSDVMAIIAYHIPKEKVIEKCKKSLMSDNK